MRSIIYVLLSLTICLLIGCQDTANQPAPTEPNDNNQTADEFLSIRDFQDSFHGDNVKNDLLEITEGEEELTLSIEVAITQELLHKLQNTTNEFYYTFADLEGSNEVSEALEELPRPIEGQALIDSLNEESSHFIVQQELHIKNNVTQDQLDYLTNPANYELQTLDEERLPVHAIIGLDISTFDTL
ncbi:hypothetical protein FLK61_27495 [Paenalkalicoccus suaedae]|uniref:DUF5067 domain-containing protein n=1 Tax=Paenalkalicoccus suaedae TaxID=2592382 RepID=A0A859FC29_9BACI|nr:hypothetical protein [Paenalkalicoccus suaedae]QKS70500.1 hypothetical protein FLK61_27495 [Paenalkalicoccus suaedae]